MFIIGLTGSIAMGKSKTAAIFAEYGVPVFDSDRYVHDLYAVDGGAIAIFDQDKDLKKVIVKDKKNRRFIDRKRLSALFFKSDKIRDKVEHIVHTLVRYGQNDFIDEAKRRGYNAVVLDIPLLYETGAEARVDMVCVVTAPKSLQRQRVLRRSGMDETKLKQILARQIPDGEKRQRADIIINTGLGKGPVRRQVGKIVSALNLPLGKKRALDIDALEAEMEANF